MRQAFVRVLLITRLAIVYSTLKPHESVVLAQDPVMGVDYAPGEVVIRFKDEYMPSQSEVQSSPPAVGISALDDAFEELEATRLDKLVPTYGELETDLGQAQERTFLLRYSSGEDPIAVAEALAEHDELCFVSA